MKTVTRARRWLACVTLAACPILISASGCSKKAVPEEIATEVERREELKKRILAEEDASRAGGVSSRPDVVFEDGFSKIMYDPPDNYRNHAFRWMGGNAHARLKSHGDKRMKIRTVGWINEPVLKTRPVLTFNINGRPLGQVDPIDKSFFYFEGEVPPQMFDGREWADLNIVVSSVAFHWADPPNLAVALVFRFDWEEMP